MALSATDAHTVCVVSLSVNSLWPSQCLNSVKKSCSSSCLESQIINMKLKEKQQASKVVGLTCGNFQHWACQHFMATKIHFAHAMTCCLTAPSHYMNQFSLTIRGVLWHSPKTYFTGLFKISDCNLTFTSPNSQY